MHVQTASRKPSKYAGPKPQASRKIKRLFEVLSLIPTYHEKHLDMQYCVGLLCGTMDKTQYKQLLENAKAKRDRKAQENNEEYDREVQAIETVWRMIEEGQAPNTPSVADAIREAVNLQEEPFTVAVIRNMIALDHPEMKEALKMKTLSGHITRMHQRGEIDLIQPGSGTRPAVYRRKSLEQEP